MPQFATLRVPGEVVFGNGCAETVGQQVRRIGATQALVISGRTLHRLGVVDQMEGWLRAADISAVSYVDVENEPSIESIAPCLVYARQSECDVVIGIGGGSVLDMAKTVAMLLRNEGAAETYIGNGLVKRPGVPTILLPTTAGTGAEVTMNALFYVPAQRAKEAIVSPYLIPTVAMVDPVLTCSVPAATTAATGVDALCHAIESYTSLSATPLSEPFAKEAVSLIATHLRAAVLNGNDLAAREGMALGSLYGAISLANASTNAVHALAYPLQGLNRITHGLANALLLPYVMEFNWLGNMHKFATVASLMGQPTAQLSERNAAAETAQLCRVLVDDVGIPSRMRDVGIVPEQMDDLVEGASKVTRLLNQNPRPIGETDIRTLFECAM